MAARDFPAFENRLIDLGLKIDTVAAGIAMLRDLNAGATQTSTYA